MNIKDNTVPKMDFLYLYLFHANMKFNMPLLIMQHMLYIESKSRGYGPIVMEILAKKSVNVKSGDDSLIGKAERSLMLVFYTTRIIIFSMGIGSTKITTKLWAEKWSKKYGEDGQ